MSPDQTPRDHYASHLGSLDREIARLEKRERDGAWVRLVVFGLFILLVWLAFVENWLSGWWSLVPLAIFVALVIRNSRAQKRIDVLRRQRDFHAQGLARVERRWKEIRAVKVDVPDDHLYADDLDLFGSASIFSLLSICRTAAGVDTLASWLLAPAGERTVARRQEAVEELRERIDLRRDLYVAGDEGIADVGVDSFTSSGTAGIKPAPLVLSLVALLLAAANVITLVGWLATDLSRIWFVLSALLSIGFAFSVVRYKQSLEGTDGLSVGLRTMLELLEKFETQSFSSTELRGLQETLTSGESAAVDGIRRLRRLVSLHDYQRNQMFYPIALLLLWETQIAFATSRWRERYGSHAAEWTRALGELEALLSLSSFAWENPDFVKPSIVEKDQVTIRATHAGHPMIREEELVRNDITIDAERRLHLVSGSNMSGKSTMLRTVGVNSVLALAGSVVSARSFELTPLEIGASIQVRDSLEEGRSRFYAEILRLRHIVESADRSPRLLFLLDEVLHGTNSHDRRIGAHAILESLLRKGASGLVTTHDLALAQIASDLPGAINVHFEDRIEADQMIFDYRMQPGVVTRSNAIELMRKIGLDV